MGSGIHAAVIWFDANAIEYLFSCSNGVFSGEASIYASHGRLIELADALTGFPSNQTDYRDFELGTFRPNLADGGIRMHFYCLDSVGHAAVEVKLRGDACSAMGEVHSVALQIPVEVAAIDSFVSQIRQMKREIGANALLVMAK